MEQGYKIVENFLTTEEHKHYLEVSERLFKEAKGSNVHYSWNSVDNLNKIEGACEFEPEFLKLASHPKLSSYW